MHLPEELCNHMDSLCVFIPPSKPSWNSFNSLRLLPSPCSSEGKKKSWKNRPGECWERIIPKKQMRALHMVECGRHSNIAASSETIAWDTGGCLGFELSSRGHLTIQLLEFQLLVTVWSSQQLLKLSNFMASLKDSLYLGWIHANQQTSSSTVSHKHLLSNSS